MFFVSSFFYLFFIHFLHFSLSFIVFLFLHFSFLCFIFPLYFRLTISFLFTFHSLCFYHHDKYGVCFCFFVFFDSLPLINLIPFSSTESVHVKLATKLSLSSCLHFYGVIVHIKSFTLQSCNCLLQTPSPAGMHPIPLVSGLHPPLSLVLLALAGQTLALLVQLAVLDGQLLLTQLALAPTAPGPACPRKLPFRVWVSGGWSHVNSTLILRPSKRV